MTGKPSDSSSPLHSSIDSAVYESNRSTVDLNERADVQRGVEAPSGNDINGVVDSVVVRGAKELFE